MLLICLPFLLVILVFSYIPLAGWIISFFDYSPGVKLSNMEFIGLKNFVILGTTFRDDVIRVTINTLAISFLYLLCSVIPLIFAIMISEIKRSWFARSVQTVTTFPYFISFVIVYSLSFSMFSLEGVVNTLLTNLNILHTPFDFLANEDIAWVFQTLVLVWKNMGWNAIVYIAAITGINQELYDAAVVDGAGRFAKIRHVTIPGISETFLVLLLLSVSNILSTGMDQYMIFMNDMVRDKIEVLDYFVYRVGLTLNDTSFATTIGMMKSVISIILLFTVNAISKKVRGHSMI
jgi:ABC-type polysaccharide transport system permease subunit